MLHSSAPATNQPDPGSRTPTCSHGRPNELSLSQGQSSMLDFQPIAGANGRPAQHQPWPQYCGSELFLQPETRQITSEGLAAEVQGIYARLVQHEKECMKSDVSQLEVNQTEEQYHTLISLHRSLLQEHHDFLLASQHPVASYALLQLASRYYMPARLWRHGIHSFLELLRVKLPGSLEHMLTFIYIAYTMMTSLYETVPAFKDTWSECLGDLGRYRMAIENESIPDRNIWKGAARYWYTRASGNSPTTGRLYHHLAILARPNALQQLYFYVKSLCVAIPFLKARDSLMTLFGPLLNPAPNTSQRLDPVDAAFVRVHGILFSGKYEDQLEDSMEQFLGLLDGRIRRQHENWLESGYHIGISLSCLMLEFGDESNVLTHAILNGTKESSTTMSGWCDEKIGPRTAFKTAVSFAARTFEIVIARWGDKTTLPCLHTLLVFYRFMLRYHAGRKHLKDWFPWEKTALLLNHLLKTSDFPPRLDMPQIPGPEKGQARPLPEDYAMRGLIYTEDYFPKNWFDNTGVEDDEKYFEQASTVGERRERILWLGHSIALTHRSLLWNPSTREFSTQRSTSRHNRRRRVIASRGLVVPLAYGYEEKKKHRRRVYSAY